MPEPENEQEYITLNEAAQELGIKRASIYYYLKALNIEPQRYKFHRQSFITRADFERIKVIKDQPWKSSEARLDTEKPEDDAA